MVLRLCKFRPLLLIVAVRRAWLRTRKAADWLCSSSHCQASAGTVWGPGALLCASTSGLL